MLHSLLQGYVGKLVTLTIGHKEHPKIVNHAKVLEADQRYIVVEEHGRRVTYPLFDIRAVTAEA